MNAGKTTIDGELNRTDAEASVKRNPHPDFKNVEKSRPPWDSDHHFHFTQTQKPDWKLGDGGNKAELNEKEHVEIDPYADGRPAVFNYKLLISAIVPRPIGFISTMSKDGSSSNLAPMSYTQVVNHDPPVFVVGFAGGMDNPKDTLKNLVDTGECVINMISEDFLEAANATAINAPFGTSEWVLSGLTPAPATSVKPSRVKELVFSVEGKLMETKEFESRATPGQKTGVLAIIEGVRFWAREDALNEERNLIDPAILKPMSRLGGISYGRLTEAIELPRPDFKEETASGDVDKLLKPKAPNQ